MAGAFNLTAQLNLKGPSNIGNVIANIKNQLGTINANVKFTLDPNAAKNTAQLTTNLQALNQTFKDTQSGATAAANAIKVFGAAVGQVGASKLQTNLVSANQASQQLAQTQSSLSDAIRSSSSEMQEFGKQAGLAVRRFTAFSSVTSVIYGLVNAASKGVSSFVDFDKEFVKLQQVTGESAQGLKALESTITGLSTGLGVSSKELIGVASTLAQAGLNALDTEKALKALALSSLAPSFDNMNETVEGSIALMRQFGISAGELDKALGSVNAVAAKFAVEASDIISAVQRTGGVFANASKGVSEGTDALNEFVAVFTSVRATTRESAETIATGLRTIFTRIQRESTIEALKEYGVNLTDVSGKFVGAYKSVELLSKGLSNLDPRDLKFSRIVEELGGFRQIGKVIPLIQEFATAQQALGVAQQGQGSLVNDSVKAQLSLANQISKTREEFLKLFREIGSSDTFQTVVRGALQVSTALIKVAESARGLLPMIGVITAIQGAKAITRFASGFGEGLSRGGNNKNDSAQTLRAPQQIRNFATGGLVPGIGDSDSVPAMLTPGEFVVRKAAVKAIGANRLDSMNKYASGGKAARIASVNKITNTVDGDTFDAEVTPTADPFIARFRLDNVDTYEKGNKKSRITKEKLESIKDFIPKYQYQSYSSESKEPIVISPFTNVGPKTTAQTMADNATKYLAENINTNNFTPEVDPKAGFGRYLAKNLGFTIPQEYTTGRYSDNEYNLGGLVQKFAEGGVTKRRVGYIDYDVIANEANKTIVEKGMEVSGIKGPRLYSDYLTQLAVAARKNSSLDKLRAIYGVAGSGKTTLARGQGTDNGTMRQTERFPILSPEDISRATEVLVLSSSVSKDKLDDMFANTDRTYTLSSTTKDERTQVRNRRISRDQTGIGLEGRTPGSTLGVATDTAVGEALLGDRLGDRSVVLGRTQTGRLRRKQGDELVETLKKKIGFTWGSFSPMTAGHESIMDSAAAMGISPQDFIYLVGANEGITDNKASSFRTAIFDQDTRVLLAKAGAGAKGATVLPKPRDFEVPQAFDISEGENRRVLIPAKGSSTFVADKTPKDLEKYKAAGYKTVNLERSGGISGTMVRDLIAEGNLAELQKVLSPGVYDLISNNIGRIQNRAKVLPSLVAEAQKNQAIKLKDVEAQIKAIGISRIEQKKMDDPEYAAKAEKLLELRGLRDKIKSAGSFEPYSLLAKLAQDQPEKYGLDFSSTPDNSNIPSIRTVSKTQMANAGGMIQRFLDGGWVKRMQKQKKSTLKEDLKYLSSAMLFADDTGAYVPSYLEDGKKEVVNVQEMLERHRSINEFLTGNKGPKSGLKSAGGYSPQELLDAITYYQGGSGPLTRAMLNQDFLFIDRKEQYETEDLVNRLGAASQYKLPKKLYSGFGRGQFNEILRDANISPENLLSDPNNSLKSLIGKIVDFPTFLSTSVSKQVAEGFVGDPGALINIDAKATKSTGIDILQAKGTKAESGSAERRLPGLDKIKPYKLAAYDQEKEFILQPNEKFKILKASGSIADHLIESLDPSKKKPEQTSTATSESGEEFTVYEPDYDSPISKAMGEKTRIDIQAQMLKAGGMIQKFAQGGRSLSPILQSIYGSVGQEPEWLKEFPLPGNVSTDVPAKTIAKLFTGTEFPSQSSFGDLAGKTITPDIVSKIWRKSYSNLMSPEKTGYYTAAKEYLASQLKANMEQQQRLTITDINRSTKVGLVGLQPADKREIQGPMKLGEENVSLFISGLSSKYYKAVEGMRSRTVDNMRQFAQDVQDTEIFGSSERYAFDFDETLVTGADILGPDGKPDIMRYSDMGAVQESMKNARLTQLGEKVKTLMELDPSFIKRARILTARPQISAGILADTLQKLGLPFQPSDITGVSKVASGGQLDMVDEQTRRINNTVIATAKAQNVTELESLIDDNLQNVLYTRKAGKKAFNYTEIENLSPEQLQASGIANIEGASLEAALAMLGAKGGTVQNRAVDFEFGLGPAAQYFPGIGSDWPTEVKRTLDSDAISDAKEHFARFFGAKEPNKTLEPVKMASGGSVKEIDQYKQVLSSILPPEFLSPEGLLKSAEGGSEQIEILSPEKKSLFSRMFSRESTSSDLPPASYDGALPYKILRHRLEQNKQQLSDKEYGILDRYISQNLSFHGKEDTIDVRKSKYKAALAHETFHDIQGFLYDNYPQIIDKLQSASVAQKETIEKWYRDPANSKYTGPGTYQLEHFFPTLETPSPYSPTFIDESLKPFKKAKTQASIPALKTIGDSYQDLGRNELIPVLLNAAAEGNSGAQQILSNIFGEAGLNKDFYKTLPKFASGGMVPGVGDSDTVPAMLNVGDFVIKKSSVKSIGAHNLASMAGYASGGSVSDQVPALLTPGEFVFSKTSAEKIGYNKLHSMNSFGKFATGGMVGGRLALASGGEASPFVDFASRVIDFFKEVNSQKLPVRPGESSSSSISIDGSTTQTIRDLASAVESLGIKSSETAVLIRRGGDISYKAAEEAYAADVKKLQLGGVSTEELIKAENNLAQIREKSAKVTANRSFIESSIFESKTGRQDGFGAAQQKIVEQADKVEAMIQRYKEKTFASQLQMPGASQEEINRQAKILASSPEEKSDTKDKAFLYATQKITGINRSEFQQMDLSGGDIRQYISQAMLDRKTLADMDKQLIKSKLDEVRNSAQFAALSGSEQKKKLDETTQLAQQEVEARRKILDEIAKSQGLPSLAKKDIGSTIADGLGSRLGVTLTGLLTSVPRLANTFGPPPSNSQSAATRAGIMGGAEVAGAGLQLAAQSGPAAPYVLAATAVASMASAFKEARNTFIEFEKNVANKQLQISITNLQQSFSDLAKDINDINIRENISRELQAGISKADSINNLDNNIPKAFWYNITDAAFSSNQRAAADRSRILENFGMSAYDSTTSIFGNKARAEENRQLYTQRLIPQRAQDNAKQFSDLAAFAQKSLETMVQVGMSFDDIQSSPEYDDIANSLAKANVRVQEQILAIENNNIENTAAAKANREAAKAAVIKAYADDQAAKITKAYVRERQAEIANRESRTFGMSFDRMFINMNQTIETTNYNLSKFSDSIESAISAMSGQAKIGTTNLDSINILKNLNVATPAQANTAIDQASSLFGSEKGLVGSILRLGSSLESSIMVAINKTIKDNPAASDTKVSMEIEKTIANRLSETKLPVGLTDQLSKQISSAIEQIRKKEGADTKNRRIDFSELIAVIPALKETFETLKNTQNAAIAALDNWKNRLDAYSKVIDRVADLQLEASQRRGRADDILLNGAVELSKAFGRDVDPDAGARLRDLRTARLTGGPTSVPDIVASLQGLEKQRNNQRDSLNSLKNSTVGQTGAVQAIIDNERALSRTNYQINQTYSALKNLAESTEAASSAMSALQSAQQKQAGKVSLLEKLIGSTPEELYNFNNALRRLQLTASGQQLGQTAEQRKEVLSVMNDIIPLLGNSQEANNLKANTLENLLRDSGVGVNIEFAKIISAIRNPEADPAIKLAADQFRLANEQQAEANRALANLGDNMAQQLANANAEILKQALRDTPVSFDQQQLSDILKGLRDVSTVVRPPVEPVGKALGGIVYASMGSMINFQPKGTDTVPAMLTPGEFVVNRNATSKHLPLLKEINSGSYASGGQVSYYADGGYVSNALKPEYRDGLKLKKSGKLSTTFSYPDITSMDDIRSNTINFYTIKDLQKLPIANRSNILELPDNRGARRVSQQLNFQSGFGIGIPETSSFTIDSSAEKKKRVVFNRSIVEPAKIENMGSFIDPAAEITAKLLNSKRLEFNQPEANAIIERNKYADLLNAIETENLIPKTISIGDSPKITSDKGSFDILSLFSSNKLKTNNPVSISVSSVLSGPLGTKYQGSLANLSSRISDYVGVLTSASAAAGPITNKGKFGDLGLSHNYNNLLDILYAGNQIISQPYQSIDNSYSFADTYLRNPYNAGHIASSLTTESSNIDKLASISKSIKDAKSAISKETNFIEPDSDKKLRLSLSFLKNLYQGLSIFEPVDSNLFDLKSIGATQDKIKVFSTDIATWNSRYLEAIQNRVKLSKDKNLESLNYFGKNPGPGFKAFEVWQDIASPTSKFLPWVDADLPIDKDISSMMGREVDQNIKNITPDISKVFKNGEWQFKKGGPLTQDVSIPYALDLTKYLNRYWDPEADMLSDKKILDGKPIYLVNGSEASQNPFRLLPNDSSRLFATESGYSDNTIADNIFDQLNRDNNFLEYLNSAIVNGYTDDKTIKLESTALDKFYSISSVADKVGILQKINAIKNQAGELFIETPDIFSGPEVSVSLREYLKSAISDKSSQKQDRLKQTTSKRFSKLDKYDLDGDGKLNDAEKAAAKADGIDLDRESYFEQSEYPGAALAMILGAQELFGPGGQYELPSILGQNWFIPRLSNAYNSIYDVPNDRIKSYMSELASYVSSRYGDIDRSMSYAAQYDPQLYDTLNVAKSYMLGANQAFSQLGQGDTEGLANYFPADIFKNQTPQGDPVANKAAIEMFASLGRVSSTSPITDAMSATGLSKDEQKSFAKKLQGSLINQGSETGNINLKPFDISDLKDAKGDFNYKAVFDLAVDPYNQYTNRAIRQELLDKFINAIPTARNTNGLPLFTASTGPEYEKSLRTLRRWYGGDEQITIPLRSWPGIDFLYDQTILDPTTSEPMPFSTKFQDLITNLDDDLYNTAIMAHDYVGGKKIFGDLPSAQFYESKEPQYRRTGGIIYARTGGSLVNFEPQGTDTVPAMLTPGEFVVNARATSEHLPLLKAINDGQEVSSSTGYQNGGVVGSRPFDDSFYGSSRPASRNNSRARTISQARSNRLRDIGLSSRLTEKDIDPTTGEIAWSTTLSNDSYKKTKTSIQDAFARVASTKKPESFESYESTSKLFQTLRKSFEVDKLKIQPEDYRKTQRFINSLEKEYLLASKGGGINLFNIDGIFKDKGLEYDEIEEDIAKKKLEAQELLKGNPDELAYRMRALEVQRKNRRIGAMTMPPRLTEKGLNTKTGELSFTPTLNNPEYDFSEKKDSVQSSFTELAARGKGLDSRLNYAEYKGVLGNIRELKADLKSKVNDMSPGEYGQSAAYLFNLERELEMAARGGGLGAKSMPEMYKPVPYASSRKERLNQMTRPREINEQFLDRTTGKIIWPLALTDAPFDETRQKVEKIFAELMSTDVSSMSYEEYTKNRQTLKDLDETLKDNLDEYKSGNYGEAKGFLTSLTRTFEKVSNQGKTRYDTDWRKLDDPKRGPSVNDKFLKPDGSISWPSVMLRDPAFAKFRAAIEKDMKTAAESDGQKFDPKQTSSFEDFIDELNSDYRSKDDESWGLIMDYTMAKSFVDTLKRSYINASKGQGQPIGGMRLSEYRDMQNEIERQKRLAFAVNNPTQMVSDNLLATEAKSNKLAESLSYDTMAQSLSEKDLMSAIPGVISNTGSVLDRAIQQANTKKETETPVEAQSEPTEDKRRESKLSEAALAWQKQRDAEWAYEDRANRTRERVIKNVEREGVWNPIAYDLQYRKLIKSGVPTKEGWKAADFRAAIEKELLSRGPDYAYADHKTVPSTYYTQSPEYKAAQEQKTKDKEIKGPYYAGIPGIIDQTADRVMTGAVLPLAETVMRASTVLRSGSGPEMEEVIKRNREEFGGDTRLAQEKARKDLRDRMGAANNEFGGRIGDESYRRFLDLKSEDQKEYLDLRKRAQKGLSVSDYQKLDSYQEALDIPWRQRENIPQGIVPREVLEERAKKQASARSRLDRSMKNMRTEAVPLLASNRYIDSLPDFSEEGATPASVLLKGVKRADETYKTAEDKVVRTAVQAGMKTADVVLQTGDATAGGFKMAGGFGGALLGKVAEESLDFTGLTSYAEGARAFTESSLEFADRGINQAKRGAGRGIGSLIAPEFYEQQAKEADRRYQQTYLKQESQVQSLLGDQLGAAAYAFNENLTNNATTAAVTAVIAEGATKAVSKGFQTIKPVSDTPVRPAFTAQESAEYIANNQPLDRFIRNRPQPIIGQFPPAPQPPVTQTPRLMDIKTPGGATRLIGTSPTGFNNPPKPSTWIDGIAPQPSAVAKQLEDRALAYRTLTGDLPVGEPIPVPAQSTVAPGLDTQVPYSPKENIMLDIRAWKGDSFAPSNGPFPQPETVFPVENPALQSISDQKMAWKTDGMSRSSPVSEDFYSLTTAEKLRLGVVGAGVVGAFSAASAVRNAPPPALEVPEKKALGGLIRGYAIGGVVAPSSVSSPYAKGTDTVPAMLTPGEFVVNARATKEHLPLLQKLNKGGMVYLANGTDTPIAPLSLTSPTIPAPQLVTSGVNSNEPLAPIKPMIMSDNPAIAGIGAAGASLDALSYGIYGGAKIAGALALSPVSAYASAKNNLLRATGLRDEKTYQQASAEIGGFNTSLWDNAMAGASDVKNYAQTASGNKDLMQDNGEQRFATATQDRKDVDAVTQEFGNTAGTVLWASQAASYATTNALAGKVGLDPIGGAIEGVSNAPQIFRNSRAVAGQALVSMGAPELGSAIAMNSADRALAATRVVEAGQAAGARLATGTSDVASTPWFRKEGATFRATGEYGSLPKTTVGSMSEIPAGTAFDVNRTMQSAEGITVAGHLSEGFYTTHIGTSNVEDALGAAESAVDYAAGGLRKGASLEKSAVILPQVKDSAIDAALSRSHFDPTSSKAVDGMIEGSKALGIQLGDTAGKTASDLQAQMTRELISRGVEAKTAAKTVHDYLPNGISAPSSQLELGAARRGTTVAFKDPSKVLEAPLGEVMTLADLTRRESLLGSKTINNINNGLSTYGGATHISSKETSPEGFAIGGEVNPFVSKGRDRVPAMLTPGEFVVNSDATQKNLSLLQEINSGSIKYASNGALIGTKSKNIDTRPSDNERSVLGAIGTGYYSRGGIVEYLRNGGRANSQFIGDSPISSGVGLYRPESERIQYQAIQPPTAPQENIVNQSTNMATQSGVLNNNTNMQSGSGGSGMFGGMDISAIQKVFDNFRQDLTVLQESVSQFTTGAEAVASSANQYKEVSTNLASASEKLANVTVPDQLNVSVTSNLDKLGAGVTSEISNTIMRGNQGLMNSLQNYSDNGDQAMAKRAFNDSEGAVRLN